MNTFPAHSTTDPSHTMTTSDLTPFCRAYLECALWSSTYSLSEDENEGIPMDRDFGIEDISRDTLCEAAQDCAQFEIEIAVILEQHGLDEDWSTEAEQFGHDFWLSRNGHGAGFFDRGSEDVWKLLQSAARAWGEVNLYVGDDGQIHS